MAIKLNQYALLCERAALDNGSITPNSSARPLLYDISRKWRELLDATGFQSQNPGPWSEREAAACEVMISCLAYLQRIGCTNIERLMRDILARYSKDVM